MTALYPKGKLSPAQLEVRELALKDLGAFIHLVAKYQLLAHCHVDLCNWVRKYSSSNKLVLWPRDHGKSRFCAFYAAWNIVKNPAITIIYGSATAEKAEEQLRFIKDILTSDAVRRYFPGLINEREGHRTAWNLTNIIIDHPYRKSQGVVDATLMTCGLEKTITGKHCDIFIWDDIVVPENNTIEGRRKVNSWAAQAASIMSADAHILAVGTRYHPKDAYGIILQMTYRTGDDEVENPEDIPLFIITQQNVEEDGQFLWPRMQRDDGKWFGFNDVILARKKAVYEASGEIVQFYAQYYNNPNDTSTSPIGRDLFQYYDRKELKNYDGVWHVQDEPLYVYAAVDLAATIGGTSDYTVVIIGGIDRTGNRYVLDVKRYRTDKISMTLNHLKALYTAYMYKKLRIEAVSGFRLVAEDLAQSLHDAGIRIPIDFYNPPRNETKAVRVNGILEPLYQAQAVYHFKGGLCQILEDELCSINPAHDDLKDAWAMCIDVMERVIMRRQIQRNNVLSYHRRWGGVAV